MPGGASGARMASSSGQGANGKAPAAAVEAPLTQEQPRRRRPAIDFDEPPPASKPKVEKCTDPDCLPESCRREDFDIKIIFTKTPEGEKTRNAAFLFNEAASEPPEDKAARKKNLEMLSGSLTWGGTLLHAKCTLKIRCATRRSTRAHVAF